jgi:hypothetical protein
MLIQPYQWSKERYICNKLNNPKSGFAFYRYSKKGETTFFSVIKIHQQSINNFFICVDDKKGILRLIFDYEVENKMYLFIYCTNTKNKKKSKCKIRVFLFIFSRKY